MAGVPDGAGAEVALADGTEAGVADPSGSGKGVPGGEGATEAAGAGVGPGVSDGSVSAAGVGDSGPRSTLCKQPAAASVPAIMSAATSALHPATVEPPESSLGK